MQNNTTKTIAPTNGTIPMMSRNGLSPASRSRRAPTASPGRRLIIKNPYARSLPAGDDPVMTPSTKTTMIWYKVQYQYSAREALPLNVAKFRYTEAMA